MLTAACPIFLPSALCNRLNILFGYALWPQLVSKAKDKDGDSKPAAILFAAEVKQQQQPCSCLVCNDATAVAQN